MKKFKFSLFAIALVAILSAFATSPMMFNKKYAVLGEGGSGGSAYWILDFNNDITGQLPDQEHTYTCDTEEVVKCAVEVNSTDVFTVGSEKRVLKSLAGTPEDGQFINIP